MVHVGRLTGLRRLTISGTSITDAGMAHVRSLTRLRNMYSQWNMQTTGAWLVHLEGKQDITWLGVFTNGLRDEHLAPIAGADQLDLRLAPFKRNY